MPDTVAKLDGFDVVVEKGAGVAAGIPTRSTPRPARRSSADAWKDVEGVAKVAPPSDAGAERSFIPGSS